MKKVIFTAVLAVLLITLGAITATAKDGKEGNVTVELALQPAPHCQNCVNKIKGNLRFEKGVKAIDVDLQKKTVIVTYSPKATNVANLEKALKKIGYTANPYTASCCAPVDSCTTMCP